LQDDRPAGSEQAIPLDSWAVGLAKRPTWAAHLDEDCRDGGVRQQRDAEKTENAENS